MKFRQLLAVFAVIAVTSAPVAADPLKKFCRLNGNIAEEGMRYHQRGGDFNELLASHELAPAFQDVYAEAFEYPRMDTREDQERISRLFGEVARLRCEGVI